MIVGKTFWKVSVSQMALQKAFHVKYLFFGSVMNGIRFLKDPFDILMNSRVCL